MTDADDTERPVDGTVGFLEADALSESVGVSVRGTWDHMGTGEAYPTVELDIGDGSIAYHLCLDREDTEALIDALYDALADAEDAVEEVESDVEGPR